jgi:hypothetical protein
MSRNTFLLNAICYDDIFWQLSHHTTLQSKIRNVIYFSIGDETQV